MRRLAEGLAVGSLACTLVVLVVAGWHVGDPGVLPDRAAYAAPGDSTTDVVQTLRIDRMDKDVGELRAWIQAELQKIRDDHTWIGRLLLGNLVGLLASAVTYILARKSGSKGKGG